MAESHNTKERQQALCTERVRYQEDSPLSFKFILDEINVDFAVKNAILFDALM
ncbi:MAG: hypothetical protein ACK5L0_04450 [Candidatus Fimivivens sp.]